MVDVQPDPIKSPQGPIIDELIWSRLSKFWTKVMDPSDRDALSAMYEAFLKGLDAEYVRLFQINKAKSIATCPIFTQRRWLRLDLNRYRELKAWLRFLSSGLQGAVSGTGANLNDSPVGTDTATCDELPTNHARHWHLNFPFRISTTLPDPTRRIINVGYPLVPSLVEIYRMRTGPSGRQEGTRLIPNRDFTVQPDGKSVIIRDAVPGEQFEVTVAIDLSGDEYSDIRPRVFQVQTRLGANVVQIPQEMNTGHPIHAMIIRNPPAGSSSGLLKTNNSSFTMRRESFQPGSANLGGVQAGGPGQAVLPVGTVIQPDDVVLVFGTEVGEFETLHRHTNHTQILDSGNANPAGTLSFTPGVAVQRGIFGSVGSLGHELKLFIDGKLISPSDYRYELVSNTIFFKTPLTFTQRARIDIQFTDETVADPFVVQNLHLHQTCFIESAETEEEFEIFDDGGNFDDEETSAFPFFDTRTTSNTVFLDFDLDGEEVEVYIDGILSREGGDYNITTTSEGRTRVSFTFSVEGRSILIDFRRVSALFLYGPTDLSPTGGSNYGFTVDSISGLLNDLSNLIGSFESIFGNKISNLDQLIDAARAAASGGNPLLTLFFDEFPQYADLPIDSPNIGLPSSDVRNIESADTDLKAIPFLVDHVHKPTIRLEQGVDYDVVNGEIRSSIDLLAPRGPNDTDPGVWWVPLAVFDEHLLAKNFGALLGDVQDSSEQYRNQLMANLRIRFTGPVAETVEKSAAVMLGSQTFTQDSYIRSIRNVVTAWNITASDEAGSTQQTVQVASDSDIPFVGQRVVPGQSITTPIIYRSDLEGYIFFDGKTLIVKDDLARAKEGDQVRLQLFDPESPSNPPTWGVFTVEGVDVRPAPGGEETVILFEETTELEVREESNIEIYRDKGPPYAALEGTITSVSPETRVEIKTEFETFRLPDGAKVEFSVGDIVRRGDPLQPDLATVYDDTSRPEWWKLTHGQLSRSWEFLLPPDRLSLRDDGLEDVRDITIAPSDTGYGRATVSPVAPTPPRGTKVSVRHSDGVRTSSYVVAGRDGTTVLLYPDPGEVIEGEATFTLSDSTSSVRSRDLFQLPVARAGSTRPFAQLKFNTQAGAPSILLDSAASFPEAGQVFIRLGNGSMIEVEYFSRDEQQLFDLNWPSSFEALTDENGITNLSIPAGTRVEAIWDYQTYITNPAFVLAVKERVVRDFGTVTGEVEVTEEDAPEFYDLIKNNTAVIETNTASRPLALIDVINEAMPSGSTIILQSQHVIADPYDSESPGGFARDQVLDYHPITLSFSSPDGTISSGRLTVPETQTTFALAVQITDLDSSVHDIQWTIRALAGGSPDLRILDPTTPTIRVVGVVPAGEYLVTCRVENDLGQVKSGNVTVLVDS